MYTVLTIFYSMSIFSFIMCFLKIISRYDERNREYIGSHLFMLRNM